MEPVRALKLERSQSLLDLCAAPGGKSLALLSSVSDLGEVVLNDSSPTRVRRLKANLETQLPRAVFERLKFLSKPGGTLGGRFPQTFDRVLADVPCSSERHLLEQPSQLEKFWNPKRSKRLAKEQLGLLRSGLAALKPGGRLVYSTCALLDEENDGVVGEAIARERKKGCVVAAVFDWEARGRRTEFGFQWLPGEPEPSSNAGPIYTAVLVKDKTTNGR